MCRLACTSVNRVWLNMQVQLGAANLKKIWMKPHSTMPHSAENRKGPMNLHFTGVVNCCHGALHAVLCSSAYADGPCGSLNGTLYLRRSNVLT